MSAPVQMRIEGGIAYLTLNRPEAGNAIDLTLAHALLQAVIRCDQDAGIRCVVLSGSGRFFCTGGDLGAFKAAGDEISGFLSEIAGVLHMSISRLMRMNKPMLVLVNGPAAGAGFSLALAGDIVVATRGASFAPAYGSVGLSPDGGLTWHLPRLLGMRRAQEVILLNQRLSAVDAAQQGLITLVVDDDALHSEGARLARALADSATAAIGRTRRLLLETYGGGLESHLEKEARCVAESGAGPEAREGVTAFSEKRQPNFQVGV
ncbi:enoyl-CoA hydratase [Pseudomonas sp. BN414]|uniref:enoyl-CoA hydratase/isomerase family protein n=1 Tax=Pseudomonas sp. BN414 TaxID=2567888 RepID=UPI002457B533|nr:enoyl-CoA hydratase-related protein [Pseudomonas sp. BN414]MDH4565464.1 enoyl-CoA hydratase [Pseudomonas sp. BN414]